MKLKTWLGMALVALAAGMASADGLEVSAYWQDHMVLQRGKKITVWGKDAAGRRVTVSFANQAATATTGDDGFWETTFAQPFDLSATPQTLTISDDAGETLSRTNILVGDVFLAGGQSNMDRFLTYKQSYNDPQSVKDFCKDDDGIRFIRIAKTSEHGGTVEELYDLPPIKPADSTIMYYGDGHDWAAATGEDRMCVSSVALNFAHYLRNANAAKGLDIPIGIVHASVGGSFIRNWMSPATIRENGLLGANGLGVSGDSWYWDEMIAPLLRAKFCAILWYQGCSDADKQSDEYKNLMDILVRDWRSRWGENGDLPFYAVQIATPGYGPATGTIGLDQYPAPTESSSGANYVRVREAQRLWDRTDTGTHGLATIVDCVKCLGTEDLHPNDKNFVGRRLSLFARRDLYGEPDLPAEGPVYTRAVREADGAVRIFFKSGTAQGLTAGRMKPASDVELSRWVKKGSDPIRGFALGDGNGNWADAEATVEGETVVLRAEGLANPTKFHYGYWCITRSTELEDGQRLNLYNGSGLPMSPVAPQAVEDPDSSAKTADPVLLPASCFFSPSTNVTLACATSGATIRYTLDGSDPTATSAAYAGPIALSATTTVKARAFAANKDPSDIVFATYTLGEAPAPEPNPQWTNGAYDPSAWAPLGENLLASATASHTGNLSGYAGQDMAKLTDGAVPVDFSSNEVIGFGDMDAIWTFDEPKTIGKIRISSRWSDQTYANIGVNDVYVLKDGAWVALGVPDSHRTGVSSIPPGSLTATLEDDAFGYLAQNVSALKISFNRAGANVAQYYAEIEAIAPGGEVQPAEMVATPAFNPAACSFFPSTNVALTCATLGATIRYTLDGSNPTASSTEYTAPIALSATTTIKARAYADGMNPSGIASAIYTLVDPNTPGPGGDPTVTTNGMWQASSCAPASWTALANNLLAGKTGTISGAVAGDTYASNNPNLLTDGSVPTAGGKYWIVGFQNNASISWTFETAKTLEQVRISCGYLNDQNYSGFTVSAVEVQTFGTTEWTTVNTAAGQMTKTGQADILLLVLADGSRAPLAENVGALRVTFGTPPLGFANYCAEIEAVGTASGSDPNPPDPPATYDIAITAPQNGTLETSVTNNVAAGTTVTVTATPASGYQLVSVTTNGTALAGNTFTMPSANVTVAATFEEQGELTYMFYIGETGYDSWADVYAAAKAGDTIVVGKDAEIRQSSGAIVKSVTIDLCGRTLSYASGWLTGCSVAVVDSGAPDGEFEVSAYSMNIAGGILDLSALASSQVTGRFQMNGTTVLAFPGDRPFADCTSVITVKADGSRIVVQGASYRWDGTEAEWMPEGHDITITAPQNGTLETSATNNVAVGTTVTVIATPAAGYRLASVTTNSVALAGLTFAMPDEDVTVAATFEEIAEPTSMFYIGEQGYDSWTNAFAAATNGATIVVGKDAVIYQPNGTINKSITIDLCGRTLTHTQGWLMNASVAVVDTGSPNGRFDFSDVSRLNISRGLLDLSALADGQVDGMFQMSATSLLRFPSDQPFDACTNRVAFDAADPAHGVGARIVVQGVTYTWNGSDWGFAGYPAWLPTDPDSRAKYDLWSTKNGVADPATAEKDAYLLNCENTPDAIAAARAAFRIASIFVHPNDDVDLGLSPAPEGGYNGTVVILGCATVDGTYHARPDATTADGALYRVPASDDRFFQAALDL